MSNFDAVTTWERAGEGRWVGEIPESWMQGRAAYGGVVTASALRALRAAVGEERPARSLSASFLAPVGVGEVAVEVRVLRAGRSLTHAEARVSQSGEERAVILAAFGGDRDSAVSVPGEQMPRRIAPEKLDPLPYIPGVIPAFVQHLDMRWTDGGVPFSGDDRSFLGGWCRHRGPATGPEAIVGLIDGWPAPVLPMTDRITPASTVRWSVHFVGPPADGRDWHWFRSEALTASAGYASMMGRLYGPDGGLTAWMEQTVVYFDR
jgi:acyl-CoA thioesterase